MYFTRDETRNVLRNRIFYHLKYKIGNYCFKLNKEIYMSLRTKFLRNILPPSIIGILITAVIAITFLLSFYLNIIEDTKEQILEQEYMGIKSISDSLSLNLQEYFNLKLSYLEESINYSESYGFIPITANPQVVTALNAHDIAVGIIDITEYPDYQKDLLIDKSHSMWYLNPSITNVSSLPQDSLNRLLFAYELEFNIKAIYEAVKNIRNIYIVFMDDGLQLIYPASRRGRYRNFTSFPNCPYNSTDGNNYYDLRCTSQMLFGLDFLKTAPLNTTLFISKTFILLEYQSVGVTLCAVHYKNSTSANFSQIPLKDRVVEYAICGEYLLDDVQSVFDFATSAQQGYSYVLDRFNNIIFHPRFKDENFTNGDKLQSITEYEFDVNDSLNDTFAINYNNTILPLVIGTYQQSDDYYGFQNQVIKLVYSKNDGEYIGTLSPIFFPLTGSTKIYHGANLVFVEPSQVVMQVKLIF